MGIYGNSKKYKKVVEAVYPSTPDGEIQMANVGKLVHFCELFPQKLLKVAVFLEKRVSSDLPKQRLGYVAVSLRTYNELIRGCRKHLTFFSVNYVRVLKMLLESDHAELKILAAESFVGFAEVQDETTQFPDLEAFVGFFVDMCQNQNRVPETRLQLRLAGLKGLRAYISILDLVGELDAFLSRHIDPASSKTRIIPAILDNMMPAAAVAGAEHEAGAPLGGAPPPQPDPIPGECQHLASEVLRDLSSRVNNITVTALLNGVLQYLDAPPNKWLPHNTFAILVLKSISTSIKPQHYQIMMTRLLQHLDLPLPVPVRRQVVLTVVNVINEASPGPIIEFIDYLLRHLLKSIEICSGVPAPSAVDMQDQRALQVSIVDSIGVISKKVPSPLQKMEASAFIMHRLLDIKRTHPALAASSSVGGGGGGGDRIVTPLLECVLQVSQTLTKLPSDSVPSSILGPLLDLGVCDDPAIRVLVLRIIRSIIVPGKTLDQMWNIVSSKSDHSSNGSNTSGALAKSTSSSSLTPVAVSGGSTSSSSSSSSSSSAAGAAGGSGAAAAAAAGGAGGAGGSNPPVPALSSQASFNTLASAYNSLWSPYPSVAELTGDTGSAIRDCVYQHGVATNSQPANCIHVFESLLTFLLRCKNKELQPALPILFKLQKVALSRRKLPPLLARSVHTVVGAYLLALGRVFECAELDAYVGGILDQRKEKGMGDRHLEIRRRPNGSIVIASINEAVYDVDQTKYKHANHYIPFEKEEVVRILSTVPSIQQDFKSVKKLERSLLHNYHDSLRRERSDTTSVLSGSGTPRGSGESGGVGGVGSSGGSSLTLHHHHSGGLGQGASCSPVPVLANGAAAVAVTISDLSTDSKKRSNTYMPGDPRPIGKAGSGSSVPLLVHARTRSNSNAMVTSGSSGGGIGGGSGGGGMMMGSSGSGIGIGGLSTVGSAESSPSNNAFSPTLRFLSRHREYDDPQQQVLDSSSPQQINNNSPNVANNNGGTNMTSSSSSSSGINNSGAVGNNSSGISNNNLGGSVNSTERFVTFSQQQHEAKKVSFDTFRRAMTVQQEEDHQKEVPTMLLSKGLAFDKVVTRSENDSLLSLSSHDQLLHLLALPSDTLAPTPPTHTPSSSSSSHAQLQSPLRHASSSSSSKDDDDIMNELSTASTLRMNLGSFINVF